jgi:hypothetical protein
MPCINKCPLYDDIEKDCSLTILADGLRIAVPQVLKIIPKALEIKDRIAFGIKSLRKQ